MSDGNLSDLPNVHNIGANFIAYDLAGVKCQRHWYHAIDTHKKSVITDTALIESLETQHSGQTKH